MVVDAGADLAALAGAGVEEFAAAARARLSRFCASRLSHRIVRAFHTALTDPIGVTAQRPGALDVPGWSTRAGSTRTRVWLMSRPGWPGCSTRWA